VEGRKRKQVPKVGTLFPRAAGSCGRRGKKNHYDYEKEREKPNRFLLLYNKLSTDFLL